MLDYAARGETGITFYSVRGEILSALAWREVRERAQVTARRLIGAGFAAGERILITADTWPGFFDVFFGAQYAGLLPVPVSIPVGIGGKEAYLDQLRRQLAASGAVAAVGVDDLAGFLADRLDRRRVLAATYSLNLAHNMILALLVLSGQRVETKLFTSKQIQNSGKLANFGFRSPFIQRGIFAALFHWPHITVAIVISLYDRYTNSTRPHDSLIIDCISVFIFTVVYVA